MHTKKGTFISYIVTAKEAEKVLDFEAYSPPYRTRSIQSLIQAIDYIYSLRFTELAHKPKVYITVYLILLQR